MKFLVKFIDGRYPKTSKYPHVVLVQDNWDDYGYRTTFQATLHLSEEEELSLGNIKILHEDQTGGFTPMPKRPFQELGPGYCSLGGNLDYYEQLFKCKRSVSMAYLRGLGDVTYNDDIKSEFEDLEGYAVSVLRFSGAERTIRDARKLFDGTKPKSKPRRRRRGFKVKFKTRVARLANSFSINFDFQRNRTLPNRVNVLIGYNGTGKTKLLSNLATVTSGYGYRRKEALLEKRAGGFVGTPPPFKSVIVVSYSAFDTFVIPGQTEIEKTRLQEEGDIFGYVYCGLREREDEANDDGTEELTYRLKTPQEIEAEFLTSLKRVREAERLDALLEVIRPLLTDASFQRIGLTQLYSDQWDDDIEGLFHDLSSGHKIVLKIAVELTAHMDDKHPTLVLIDEPETHLHPPLLAALLKSVRVCLDYFNGYAVIATHSPVVLQETPSRYVHVLRRNVENSKVDTTSIETFGENIGVITQDVFNLDDGSTDWHGTLQSLAGKSDLESIEDMFGRKLGFASRSYIVSVHDELKD